MNLDSYKPGTKFYTILRHRSASGMRRSISVIVIEKGEPREISYRVAELLGRKIDNNHGGIIVNGCGMDMGFEIIYNLGRKLFPKGFRRNKKTGSRNGDPSKVDRDGGYAFRQEWL